MSIFSGLIATGFSHSYNLVLSLDEEKT